MKSFGERIVVAIMYTVATFLAGIFISALADVIPLFNIINPFFWIGLILGLLPDSLSNLLFGLVNQWCWFAFLIFGFWCINPLGKK